MSTMKFTKIVYIWLALAAALGFVSCASDEELSESLDASKDKINSPASVSFSGNETTAKFSIKASGLWNITGKPDWFNLSATQGMGDASITITTTDSENPSAIDNRTATIVLSTDTRQREITIQQSPAEEILNVNEDTLLFARNEETLEHSFVINNNSTWEILDKADWYSVSPAMSGSGTTTITISVKKNEKDWNNTHQMTIKGVKSQENLVIFQQGVLTSLSVSPSAIQAKAIAGSYSIIMDGDASWTASTDAAWTTLSALSGKGTYALNIDCAANETNAQRNATITIETSTKTFKCVLTQAVAALPQLTTPTKVAVGKYNMTVSSSYSSVIPVSEYGIVYSQTRQSPSISSDTKIVCTTGENPFTLSQEGLPSGVTYYVRAYAISGAGVGYSETIEVTTGGSKPDSGDNSTPNL